MDDTISRRAAIDALGKVDDYGDGIAFEVLSHAQMYISLLPSAERRGRWIPDFNGKFKGGAYWFHCSHCKRIVPDIRNGGWNYCPNCGSKMERE